MSSLRPWSWPVLLCGGLVIAFTVTDAQAVEPGTGEDSWPQWRGPGRTGQVRGSVWPDSLDEAHLKEAWHVKLQPSYSGPIIVGPRVFTTETRDKKTEHVTAYDRATGKSLWTTEWDGSLSVPFFAKANGDWIRATPACDGMTLFVGGIRDVLAAIDVSNGNVRWRVDLAKEFEAPAPTFGFVASPLILGDAVYVQAGAGFVKLDKATGKVIWRVLKDAGGMNGSAFASPMPATIHGRPQILVQGREALSGVDPESGKVFWTTPVEAFRGMNILTPTALGDQLFTSTYGGGSFLFRVDQPNSEADASIEQVWRNKVQGYMSTPIVIDGHAYLHLRNQRFTCLDLKTGKETWTTTPFGKYWSLVAQGNKLLALDETGMLRLIRANPEKYELLSERELRDNSWAHLAVVGNEIYIRDLVGLTRYDWK